MSRPDYALSNKFYPSLRAWLLQVWAKFGRFIATLGQILWPSRPLIGEGAADQDGVIDSEIWGQLHFLAGAICQTCGTRLEHELVPDLICGACLADPPPFDKARAILAYDDISRILVLDLKHGARFDGLKTYGQWLRQSALDLIGASGAESAQWHIVPVPAHWTRLLMRGHNPAAFLSLALFRALKKTQQENIGPQFHFSPHILARHKRTGLQKGRSRLGRARNVAGAFKIGPKAAINAATNILLIDDVYTTGATLHACVKVLKRAGVGNIYCLSLLRVVRPLVMDGAQ